MNEEREFALELSRAAGAVTLEYFGRDDLVVDKKHDESPVTEADRAAEELLRTRIERRYPADGILGEEFGELHGKNGRRWILDPIDGTRSFERNVPLYGNLIALEVEGEIAVGVIHMPALRELVHAASGAGAEWITRLGTAAEKRRPARVSTVSRPRAAMFGFTSIGGFARAGHPEMLDRLRSTFGKDRGWSDCYGHLLVATGRIDVMVDPMLAPWDAAALKVVVEESGGTFTDLEGRATHLGGSGMSTNGALFDHALAAVSG